jgi:hypothetical protein
VKNFEMKKLYWVLPLSAALGIGLYLFYAWRGYGLGYPLDDAWIHQTYARNLVSYGQWMFLPGVVSGGSTSPLWTILLTPAFLLGIHPVIYTSLLGFVLLMGLGWLAFKFLVQHSGNTSLWWLAGIVILEWHFVWAALSGMETLLQTVFNLGIAVLLFYTIRTNSSRKQWFTLGLIIGLGVWIRPDAITWVGPAGLLVSIAIINKEKDCFKKLFSFVLGIAIPFCGYLVFNLKVAGSIWPNTMYAKQAEYAAHLNIPFVKRYLQLLLLPFIGGTFLLLPGVVYQTWRAVKIKNMYWISLYLWWLGMIFIYALKLPVTYQHGRYMIPTMIFPILFGIYGSIEMAKQFTIPMIWKDRLFFTAKALLIGLQIAFLFLGAHAFQEDVGVIETEMVQTALWVKDNIPDQAVLAVHDIGAMGYFSEHDFYDLAGLINPEVIPFIRDEEKLSEFLDEKDVEYIVVFPSWYGSLVENKEIYYTTNAALSPSLGGENMTIFCWKKCR